MPTVATATGTLFMVSILLDLLAHIFEAQFFSAFSSLGRIRTIGLREKEERGKKRWTGVLV